MSFRFFFTFVLMGGFLQWLVASADQLVVSKRFSRVLKQGFGPWWESHDLRQFFYAVMNGGERLCPGRTAFPLTTQEETGGRNSPSSILADAGANSEGER